MTSRWGWRETVRGHGTHAAIPTNPICTHDLAALYFPLIFKLQFRRDHLLASPHLFFPLSIAETSSFPVDRFSIRRILSV